VREMFHPSLSTRRRPSDRHSALAMIPLATAARKPAFPIVAIGASTGGMVAIEELLKTLDPATGMGFVIIMHLEADRKSYFPEIIAKLTSMKVFEATEGTAIKPNCIYVMAAGVLLSVAGGILHTTVRTEAPVHNKPVDHFFHALAADSKAMAVGVILSGGDGDGSEGCKSIEAAGGHMFIQDPNTAVNGSMPINADHTGCDDFMGSPKELALKLSRFFRRQELAPRSGELDYRGFTDKKYRSVA
jgi:two-component system CheB/CheR fusion protein